MGGRVRQRYGAQGLRLSVALPAVLLGLPVPGSENPVIAAPVGELEAEFSFWSCGEPKLEGREEEELGSLWRGVTSGLGLELCARVDVLRRSQQGNEYFPLSTGLLYALHREHGERLDAEELVEMASQLEELREASWRVVYEALWYSAYKGAPVAYRNLSEAFELDFRLEASLRGEKRAGESRVAREVIGEELYGAIVHLVGSAVLEASLRLREGQEAAEVLKAFAPLHEGAVAMVWGLPPTEGCLWSPGTYNSFSLLCPKSWGANNEV